MLTIREFIEWEYNGGKGDFQPHTTTRTWNNLPVDAKIGYVACSVYGDIVGKSKLFLKTDNKTYEKGDIILPSEKSAWFEDEELGAIKSIEYLPVNQEALKEVLRAEKERRTKQAKTTTVSI